MIIVIEGLAGSGKTWLMSRLVRKEWKRGYKIYPGFPMWFDEARTRINRWHNLDETYRLKHGIICIDEGQKILSADNWRRLPLPFKDLISTHRHYFLDIFTTTQNVRLIDIYIRRNIHEIYTCRNLFRFPGNQRVKPFFQIIKSKHKERIMLEDDRVAWKSLSGRLHFISRFWTKTYYNTYGELRPPRFICQGKYQRKAYTKIGKWSIRMINRELIDRGKRRI